MPEISWPALFLPALIAGAFYCLCAVSRRPGLADFLQSLGFVAAAMTGYAVTLGKIPGVPGDVHERFFWMIPVVTACAWYAARRTGGRRAALIAALCLSVPFATFYSAILGHWTRGQSCAWISSGALALSVFYLGFFRWKKRLTPSESTLHLLLFAVAAGILPAAYGSVRTTQLSGAVTAAVLPLFLGRWFRKTVVSPATESAAILLWLALAGMSTYYAGTPRWCIAVLACSPWTLELSRPGWFRFRRERLRAAWRILLFHGPTWTLAALATARALRAAENLY